MLKKYKNVVEFLDKNDLEVGDSITYRLREAAARDSDSLSVATTALITSVCEDKDLIGLGALLFTNDELFTRFEVLAERNGEEVWVGFGYEDKSATAKFRMGDYVVTCDKKSSNSDILFHVSALLDIDGEPFVQSVTKQKYAVKKSDAGEYIQVADDMKVYAKDFVDDGDTETGKSLEEFIDEALDCLSSICKNR